MYGLPRFKSWASVWAIFYIAGFVFLLVKYGDSFFTPLFISALVIAAAAAIYVAIKVTVFVVKTMNEDMNDR